MIGSRIVIKTIDGQICSGILTGDHANYFKVAEIEEINCNLDSRLPNLKKPGELFVGEVRYYKRNIIYSYIVK
ncbi:hypothetical protein [Desulfotomaculum sp. 1211_IL3151]|uniref:hypothetical protein n=1 Tax=Desulfotomaculum sp. 1211_IL3151 TaxID=3084055 RepID=UPI002FD8D7FD